MGIFLLSECASVCTLFSTRISANGLASSDGTQTKAFLSVCSNCTRLWFPFFANSVYDINIGPLVYAVWRILPLALCRCKHRTAIFMFSIVAFVDGTQHFGTFHIRSSGMSVLLTVSRFSYDFTPLFGRSHSRNPHFHGRPLFSQAANAVEMVSMFSQLISLVSNRPIKPLFARFFTLFHDFYSDHSLHGYLYLRIVNPSINKYFSFEIIRCVTHMCAHVHARVLWRTLCGCVCVWRKCNTQIRYESSWN